VTRSSSPFRLFLIAVLTILAAPSCGRARALTAAKPLREYGRQTWQTESGLPQNTVHAVLQTRDGFLWIATEGGLVRFDGQDLLTFDTTNLPQLHSNLISDLAEDDRGVLWVATSDGLLALTADPLHPRFTRYTTADGLPSNNVQTLRRRGGGLLVLTSGGAALLLSGRLQPLPGLTAELSPALVTEGPNGALWIANGRQILSLAASATALTPAFSDTKIPAGIGSLQTIAATAQGELWVGGHDGLALLSYNRKLLILHPTPSANITALALEPNGTLWIGTAAGLAQYSNGTLRAVPAAAQPSSHAITSGRVLQLFQDRSGALWIAYELGLARLTSASTTAAAAASAREILQSPIPLPGVLSVVEDREGDMWFGTDTGGLTVLREQAFSTLTSTDGLSGDFVRAVFQDHAGTLWIGTNRGLNRLRDGSVSSLPSLAGHVVLALAETAAATGHPDLWIGTPDGLSRLHDGNLTLLTSADGLPDDFVRSLYTDRDGSLWVGTRNGLAHYSGGAFTTYSRLDGLGSDVIGAILRSRSGTLWVGTLGGLSSFDGRGFHNYTHSPQAPGGLAGDAITTLHEDSQGTLWIAAHAAGLTRLRNGVFTAIHPTEGNLPQEIFSILEDSSQGSSAPSPNLWLGSSRGIYRVGIAALNALADQQTASLPTAVFGIADGMRISECSSGGHPAAWRSQDGSLWFSTLKGVAKVKPGSGFDNPVPPLTAIEQVLIDGNGEKVENNSEKIDSSGDRIDSISQKIAGNGDTNDDDATGHSSGDDHPGGSLTLPPGTERLTLHYAGLSFAAPQKVHFRYKLEGFDHDWIDAGTRRTAYYTNLPPGSYRFLVSAANNDGVWSLAPAALPLTLEPHLYQTSWFLLLIAVALLGLGYLVYRSRLRFLAAQYQAVLHERSRIAREIHDTLAQGYVGVSVQLEVTSRLLKTSPEAAASQLEITQQLVRSSLTEARSSIWNLRSPLSANGTEPDTLPLRIASAIETRRHADGPAIRLDVRGAFRSLAPRIENEFLRIAQEAVTNSIRHSGARQIVVTLSYDTERLRLQIDDDGTGFTPAPGGLVATGHFGLKGMEERAADIGAQLHIRSEPGQGTTISLTCDLRGARASGQTTRNGTERTPTERRPPRIERKEVS
jgi:ligand-binding sensor domain-containing protein/signal transduction histidine kinase